MYAVLFRLAECRQTICSLAGLANDDGKGIFVKDRAAVAELGCQFHAHWSPCEVFQYVLGRHADMIRGSAGYDIDLADFFDVYVSESYDCCIGIYQFNPNIRKDIGCFYEMVNLKQLKLVDSMRLWVVETSRR